MVGEGKMITGYSEQEIKDKEEEIKATQKSFSEYQAKFVKAKEDITLKQGKIESLKESIELLQRELQEQRGIALSSSQQMDQDSNKIGSLKKDLEDDAYAKALSKLIEEQPEYFDLLKSRYEKRMEEISDGMEIFSGSLDSQEFCQRIKQMVESTSFTRSLVEMRGLVSGYKDYLKEICELRLKNQTIPVSKKLQRFTYFDNLINLPEVQAIWNTQ